MDNTAAVWNAPPPVAELLAAAATHRHLAVCLPHDALPPFAPSAQPSEAERHFLQLWPQQTSCIQFAAVNILYGLLPHRAELWLIPRAAASHLGEYFPQGITWRTGSLPQQTAPAVQPWFAAPPEHTPPQKTAVIGAGIAGAAVARALAERGAEVLVLEAAGAAQAASGNRQGLLYAKISAHDTEQTELLLGGYGHSRRLLQALLPDSQDWQACGVLHLNHNQAERRRNAQLAAQSRHRHLYRGVSSDRAADLAGITPLTDGLYWPQGAWLHPPALVRALLDHPLISLHEHCPLLSAQHQNGLWHLHTPQNQYQATHLVYCAGADSPRMPGLEDFPWQMIRGQTGSAAATPHSLHLKTALSGAGYISPAWQGRHCYGATFHPHDSLSGWREEDEAHNRRLLAALHPQLAGLPPSSGQGHAAIRCDNPDHLPSVGRVGDTRAMMRQYAKLAHDKNYPLDTPCPYLPNVWVSSGHGSRGLATAPWCAEAVAAEILGLPNPLSPRLRLALHPNRHTIRRLIRRQTDHTP
ncbi:MAG: FAD-dependent 5-carboxymethylaminomethyl-2-thiouridine(34) oxidoreductase MnmC [Neisseria sp.]|nr:FAD-dependent 5-carboxymethylaminomethyl-2-thiouridine(34) oxidoreductase MnmC [Neisseria sp.]